MSIQIDRNNGIPLYIQLKNQIVQAIKQGDIKIGDRMVTERELAKTLDISRKTVSHAYNLLEKEGILVPHQGKGTFVADGYTGWKSYINKEKVLKFVDLAIESAFENEISTAEFLDLVRTRAREKEEALFGTQAVFVECNIEQAQSFADQLTEKMNLNLVPVVVSELKAMTKSTKALIESAKIIIPTFNHVNEVKEILEQHNIETPVMGVAITPDLEVLVRVARYPNGTRFGLVSLSKEFFYKVEFALKSAGLNELDIKSTTTHDEETLKLFLQDVDVIIVSPGRLNEILEFVNNQKDVIRFDYSLDAGSVKVIVSRLMDGH